MKFSFFSFIARNFSTSFFSIFQVQDDGADGTHGFAMVHSVIALNEDPSDLSWFSLGLRLLWFSSFTWLCCVATNFITFLFICSVSRWWVRRYPWTHHGFLCGRTCCRCDLTWLWRVATNSVLPSTLHSSRFSALWTHHGFHCGRTCCRCDLTWLWRVATNSVLPSTLHSSRFSALWTHHGFHCGRTCCRCDLTWLWRVATNSLRAIFMLRSYIALPRCHQFIHAFPSFIFLDLSSTQWRGPMVPLESSRFSLWLRMQQRPIMIERE